MRTQNRIAEVERLALKAPGLRIGDAERSAVVDELSRHTAEGRLDIYELEERLDAVYRARTAPELVDVLAGLRASPPPMWPPQGAGRSSALPLAPGSDLLSGAASPDAGTGTAIATARRGRSTWVRVVGGLVALSLGHWAGLGLVDAAALWGVLVLTRSRALTLLSVLGLLGGHNSVGGWGHLVPIVLVLLVLLHRLDKVHKHHTAQKSTPPRSKVSWPQETMLASRSRPSMRRF